MKASHQNIDAKGVDKGSRAVVVVKDDSEAPYADVLAKMSCHS
jgi:hypothetical protein